MDSKNILCDCGHEAIMHDTGRCGGYAVNKKYFYIDKLHLGGRKYSAFCGCNRNHWNVIDEFHQGELPQPANQEAELQK